MEEMTDKEKAFIWQQGNVYSKGLASREIQNAHEKGIDYMSTHELNDVGKRILELISKYGREATFKGAICHANEKMWRYVYRGEIIGKKPLEEKMNMKKQTIKLNESQLRKIVKESVKKILKEGNTLSDFDTIRNSGWQDKMNKIFMLSKEMCEISKNEVPNGFGDRDLYETAFSIYKIAKRWCNSKEPIINEDIDSPFGPWLKPDFEDE